MTSAPRRVAVALATIGLVVAGCSPKVDGASPDLEHAGFLPAGVADRLPERRMNVVWAPEMTDCGVCNAPVSEALKRFATDYPQAGVVTALATSAPFPEHLVVGARLMIDTGQADSERRPYVAILDVDRQLLGWRRIPEFGRQEDFVYQELLGAYSMTSPVE